MQGGAAEDVGFMEFRTENVNYFMRVRARACAYYKRAAGPCPAAALVSRIFLVYSILSFKKN